MASIKDFGAFIEIVPGKDGLCTSARSTTTASAGWTTCCKMGDAVEVKVIAIDDQNRVKLSRKALLPAPAGGGGADAGAEFNGGGRPPAR